MTVSSRLLWGKRESGLTPPWAVKPFQCSTRAYPVDARGVGGSVLQGYSCSTSDAMMLMNAGCVDAASTLGDTVLGVGRHKGRW